MSPKYDRILSLLRQGLKHRNLDVENDDEQYRWQQYLDKKKLEPLNTREREIILVKLFFVWFFSALRGIEDFFATSN